MNQTEISYNTFELTLMIFRRYLTGLMIILLIIGILSNIITCLIFNRPKHRKNACSIFCAATSASNILILLQAIVGHLLDLMLPTSPENYNKIYCKARLYIRHALVMNNRTFTILSCAACYALTSKRQFLRQLIQRPWICRRTVLFSFIFWFVACAHSLFYTTIVDNTCVMIGNYTLIFAVYLFILAGTISPLLMILFSYLVRKNLRQLRTRIQPVAHHFHLKKRDFQLVRMLLVHIIIYLVTTVLYPVNLLYSALTQNDTQKTFERQVIETFITFLTTNFIFYINNVAPFFTYYFTSSSFRLEVKSFQSKYRCHQTIRPMFVMSSQMIDTVNLQRRQ